MNTSLQLATRLARDERNSPTTGSVLSPAERRAILELLQRPTRRIRCPNLRGQVCPPDCPECKGESMITVGVIP